MNINTIAAVVIFISLIVTPLLLFKYTQARAITVNSKGAQGYGIGTITCPSGLIFNNERIDFEVSKNRNERVPVDKPGKTSVTFGDWSIEAAIFNSDKTKANSGSIYRMYLSSNLKNLLINGFQQQDNVCKSGISSSSSDDVLKVNYITITGPCNTKGTTISFSSLDGMKGSFTGTIICEFLR
jgi:hypothetical protein